MDIFSRNEVVGDELVRVAFDEVKVIDVSFLLEAVDGVA